MFDLDTLTLGEVAKIEELSGQPITVVGDDGVPMGLTMAAIVFVTKRREDPSYTWNDACGMTFDQASAYLGLNTDVAADEERKVEEPAEKALDPTPRRRPTKPRSSD